MAKYKCIYRANDNGKDVTARNKKIFCILPSDSSISTRRRFLTGNSVKITFYSEMLKIPRIHQLLNLESQFIKEITK